MLKTGKIFKKILLSNVSLRHLATYVKKLRLPVFYKRYVNISALK
jgi:hypothetical protein